jgi:ankyrin repeat protein
MKTKQLCGMVWGVMIALLLMTVVFTPYLAVGDKGTSEEMKLIQVAGEGDTETVKALLKSRADVNAQDLFGRTALIMATFEVHPAVVQVLLQAGAKVNVKNNNGDTALAVATAWGHNEVIEILKKAGAKE